MPGDSERRKFKPLYILVGNSVGGLLNQLYGMETSIIPVDLLYDWHSSGYPCYE